MKLIIEILALVLIFVSCRTKDNRELKIYIEGIDKGYFALVYPQDCESSEKLIRSHIDSSRIAISKDCFVSSNTFDKHKFYLNTKNGFKEILKLENITYNKHSTPNNLIDSLVVVGVLPLTFDNWSAMIYKLKDVTEVNKPMSSNDKELKEFKRYLKKNVRSLNE